MVKAAESHRSLADAVRFLRRGGGRPISAERFARSSPHDTKPGRFRNVAPIDQRAASSGSRRDETKKGMPYARTTFRAANADRDCRAPNPDLTPVPIADAPRTWSSHVPLITARDQSR